MQRGKERTKRENESEIEPDSSQISSSDQKRRRGAAVRPCHSHPSPLQHCTKASRLTTMQLAVSTTNGMGSSQLPCLSLPRYPIWFLAVCTSSHRPSSIGEVAAGKLQQYGVHLSRGVVVVVIVELYEAVLFQK